MTAINKTTIKFKRKVEFTAAYDKRNSYPRKTYGIHGVNLWFILIGEKGVVSLCIFTNWYLPHVQEELDQKLDRDYLHLNCHPQASNLDIHSLQPWQDGEHVSDQQCSWLKKPCYLKSYSIASAEKLLQLLIEKGSKKLWKELEKHYQQEFGEENKRE